MSPATLSESASAPAALAAFLRGVERRGAVFAELQCGDASSGDSALAAAMRAFREGAAASPISDWPRRFWALLLAAPVLRRPAADADWPDALSVLARLGNGPRAALLLRLAAGLHEAEAAAVLGIAPPTYRLALQSALSTQADGTADEDAWRAVADATQLAIRQLPPARLARLAQLREAALQHRRPLVAAKRCRPATTGSHPRWLLPALWAGVVACALAFVASFLLPPPGLRHDDGEPRIRRTPLATAEPPASRFDAQTAVLTDRDFEMLLGDDDAIGDVGFQSWYAAQLAAVEPDAATTPIAAATPGASTIDTAPATARLESDDAPR